MSTVQPALFAPGAPLWTGEHVSVAASHREHDAASGFWRPWPHRVREETFVYPDEDVSVVLESIWSDLAGTPHEPLSETLGAVARRAVIPGRD